MSVKRPACGASRPEIMRIVEPELPQSSGCGGRTVTRPPTPVISTESAPVWVTFAPSAAMHARVEAQSAPVEKLREARDSFSEAAQHGVAMTDGFVAGQAQAANRYCGRGG